jgi:UDP-N-acetylglucosamine:LPS N-acetylglucosamine transferase
MGELYAICDVAITRGGTTSLAEQKLYDMKQIIVPIPRTHDQYDNAQWYVDHYKDIMINQKDIAFEKKLMSALIKLRNFRKKDPQKDKLAQISRAKEIIIKALLSL